jgi:hypothetical protein
MWRKGIPREHPKPQCPRQGYRNLMEVKTLMENSKETTWHTCGVEQQSLQNLIGKKNDEMP